MKNLRLFTPLALGAVLLFSSCGDKAPETPKGPVKYDLMQKLPKGYSHELTQWHQETFTMGGDKPMPPMVSEMTMKLRETVVDVDASGTTSFESVYESFSGKMPTPEGKMMEFNTATPSDEPGAQMFYGMIGKKLTYKCAANGKVTDVSNSTDDMMKGMFMDSSYTMSDNLEEMLNTFNFVPPQPVDSGATWTSSNGMRAMYPLWFDNTYKLVKADSMTVTIEYTAKVAPNPKPIADAMMGSMNEWNLSGTRSGTITADTKTGSLISTEFTTHVSGTMTTKADGKKVKKDVVTPVTIDMVDKMDFKK